MTWNGQERRKTARDGEMSVNTRELLIRIDERTNRMDTALFGSQGIDKRLRQVEQDGAAIKARAGVIATGISLIIAGLNYVFGKH